MTNWTNITSKKQIDEIVSTDSHKNTCVILKHSTTCSISSIAKMRLDGGSTSLGEDINWYYLDLLAHRPISNYIAESLNVHHESPQVIVVKNGEVTYDVSHLDISVDDLVDQVSFA